MAKVQLQGPRMGFSFQGQAALPVTFTWVDEEGTPTPGDLPVTDVALNAQNVICYAKMQNDNDEPKTFSTPTGTGPSPITSVEIAPFTVPAKGTVIVPVLVNFDGTQKHNDASFIDLTGESDA